MCKSPGIYSFGVPGVSSAVLLTLSGFGVGMEAAGSPVGEEMAFYT